VLDKTVRWIQNREGNVAVILAIAIVPILVLVGVAIDLQNTTTSRTFIQYTIDNAVIAGSREMQAGKSQNEIRSYINNFVDGVIKTKGYAMSCKPAEVVFTPGTQDIDVTIKCAQETTLTQLIGYQHLNFTVTSGSTYGIGSVDVSFVFDISGSMAGSSKIGALKDAAEDAVDILLPKDASEDVGDVRIAMVSYSNMVNAGQYFTKVTNQQPYRVYTDTYETTEQVCVQYKKNGKCRKWEYQTVERETTKAVNNTCVKERLGTYAYKDEDPGPGAWLEAAGATYSESYWGGSWSTESCNDAVEPLPLTDNRSKLYDYIDDLNASGGTGGHIGIAWGWYMIAPAWKSVWPSGSDPLAYDEPDSAKAIILMTDGDFLNWYNEGQGNSFDQAKKFCDNIKADTDVRIYTVAFQAPTKGQQILNYCASGADFAFKPENADELKDAYAKIAQSISDLRIRY